ncbi:MAG TPA: threonine/serine exporter family protein [Gemmatimonadales bacterium]|nr:threonine/serine exporter family protein [Gemmatimonadales bacterium]
MSDPTRNPPPAGAAVAEPGPSPAAQAEAAAPTDADAIRFVLLLGRALHTYGYAAHALEEVLGGAAARLGLRGQFFSTPTSIFASFGPQDHQRTYLIRVEPGDVDLGKLAELDAVTTRVLRGELSVAEGAQRIELIAGARPRYGPVATTIAFGLASAAASRFLGGGLREIAVASLIGFTTGFLALWAARFAPLARVFEPVAALTASAAASTLGVLVGGFSVYNATLAGLIVLVPGLSLTVAMTELSTRHLVSGTSRLSGAFALFLAIAFGVALGARLVGSLLGSPVSAEPVPLPAWTGWAALVVAPLAFTVLLRAAPRDAPWIVLAGAVAVLGGRLGAQALGPELGVFAGAVAVGIASNLYARRLDRPAPVLLVPGILLLVPGSIGFRSLASLLDREVVLGVETAFRMILMAVALVAGILVAGVVTPPRRIT